MVSACGAFGEVDADADPGADLGAAVDARWQDAELPCRLGYGAGKAGAGRGIAEFAAILDAEFLDCTAGDYRPGVQGGALR